MNRLKRRWYTWLHRRKFARLGVKCTYPITRLTVEGHVEQGDHGRFRNNATLRALGSGKIIWGNRAGASWGTTFVANELIEVGDYSAVAEYTYVTDTSYRFAGSTGSYREVEKIVKPVRIGRECFIGSRCYIGPGVTIGDGAVIGNNSIVTRDVGPLEIWMGAPARFVGHRTENLPERVRQRFEQLIAEQGVQGDRYKD